MLWFALRGLYFIIVGICKWIFDLDGSRLRELSNENYFKEKKLRDERLNQRSKVAGVGLGVVLVVVSAVWWLTPPWVPWMLLVAAVAALAYVGRPQDKPLILPATVVAGEEKPLTADIVFEALCSLGISKMTKPQDIELLYAVKPTRAGYIIDITLPRGVTATEVMAKRDKLSSGLQRGIGTVWPSVGERHEGHLVLFISHVDMSKAKQKQWSLLKSGTTNIFKPTPMFTNQKGDWVDLTLATTSGVVGAIPRMGKALSIYTLLPTPSGWISMGQLTRGDALYDESGSICHVLQVHPVQLNRPCYKVEFSDGSVIVADADHLWQVETRSGRVHNFPEKVLSTAEMIDSVRVEADQRLNYSVRVAAPLHGFQPTLPIGPYTLGAWLGDGTNRTGVITNPDPEVVAEITAEGEKVHVVPCTANDTAPGWRVKKLTGRLANLGVLNNKHIPIRYLRASEAQRRTLLAGLLDTDGWIQNSGSIMYGSMSRRLAEDVRKLVASLGYVSTMRNKPAYFNGRNYGPFWMVTFCPDIPVFRVQRKRIRQSTFDKASNHRRFIKSIQAIPSVPVRCITVDSPSSLYLVGEQCIPTHNTYFLRELALVGGLDYRVETYIFELKGTGDLSSTKKFAHYYSDEDEDVDEHLKVMRRLRSERRKRARIIRSLPDEECPRSEVTDELASRNIGLHPILVIIDELQVWTQHEVKSIQEEFVAILEDLVRRGPAVGIMVYVATQKVDAKSIPTGISANAVVRLCFKVNDATSNNQILGPGSYANGLQATMFDFVKDKGIAYLKADGPAQIVRTVFALDKVESDKVALRARALRKHANRLTGLAAGEDVQAEEDEVVLVEEILALFGTASTMHLGDIAAGLAARRPQTWGQLDAKGLGGLLRGLTPPVEPTTVYVADKAAAERSAKGLKRDQLQSDLTGQSDA